MTLNDLFAFGIDNLDFNTRLFVYDEDAKKQPVSRFIVDKSSREIEIIFDYDCEI